MLRRLKISHLPISSFEIAYRLGIKVIPYSSFSSEIRALMLKKSMDGFVAEKEQGKWTIYYNDDDRPYGRINNTIMHEIAHIILDHTEDSELAEKEVKFFAKYALAPPVLIHELNLNDICQIAHTFSISFEAAEYAFNYYQKWLEYGGDYYKDYELILLEQFEGAL